jgi:hypothetical protein
MFVKVLNNVCDIPVSKLPQSALKGDKITVMIPEEYIGSVGYMCKQPNTISMVVFFGPKGRTLLRVDASRGVTPSFLISEGATIYFKQLISFAQK